MAKTAVEAYDWRVKFLVAMLAACWLIVLVLSTLFLIFAMSWGGTAFIVSVFGVLTITLCILDTVAPRLKRHIGARD